MGMQNVTIFVDGSCKPNPGSGGWGVILRHGQYEKEISGGEPDTTNIRMEFTAALRAIEAVRRPCRITLYTDSEHVVHCIQGDWKLKKNRDLVVGLQRVCEKHKVRAIWIKGHSKVTENERCDKMAKKEADLIKEMCKL